MGIFIDRCPLCEKEFLNYDTVNEFKYYCSGGCANDAASLINNEDDITQPSLEEVDEDKTPIMDTMGRMYMMISGTIDTVSKSGKHKVLQAHEA